MDSSEFVKSEEFFTQNEVHSSKLSIESIEAFFVGDFQMATIGLIKPDHFTDSQFQPDCINEFRLSLESCYDTKCISAAFDEFIFELSIFTKQEVSSIKETYKNVFEFVVDLDELLGQIASQLNQLRAIAKSIILDKNHSSLFCRNKKGFAPCSGLKEKRFSAYYVCYVESLIEYAEYLTQYVNSYWVYTPVEIQESFAVNSKSFNATKNTLLNQLLPSEILDQYDLATTSLNDAILKMSSVEKNSPKLTLANLKNSTDASSDYQASVNSSDYYLPVFDTRYTLKDMLDKVVEKNKHDAVNRGELVGEEIW